MSRISGLLALCTQAAALFGCGGSPMVRYVPEGGSRGTGTFEVGPLAPAERDGLVDGEIDGVRGAELFALHVAPDAGEGALPPVAGAYHLSGDTLRFEPRFPLARGVRYRAVYRPGAPEAVERDVLLAAGDRTPTTVVEAVYPSLDVLPENLLRLYIHFSAPMSRGQAWDHLRLREASGREIELPFLEIDQELWDPSGKRLTVLIDPGRIKRGVRPLEEVGPALVAGSSFVLTVSREWEDVDAKPLREPFEKRFEVGPPDRTPPDPSSWRVTAPHAGTREPLAVDVRQPLDHGMLHSAAGVKGPDGRAVPGDVAVEDGERTWRFIPQSPWKDGEHRLVAATTLEDPSGNSIAGPFEVDVLEPVRRRVEVDVVEVPFRPR